MPTVWAVRFRKGMDCPDFFIGKFWIFLQNML